MTGLTPLNQDDRIRQSLDQLLESSLRNAGFNDHKSGMVFFDWLMGVIHVNRGSIDLATLTPRSRSVLTAHTDRFWGGCVVVIWAVLVWAVTFFFGNLFSRPASTSLAMTGGGALFLLVAGVIIYPLTIKTGRSSPVLRTKRFLNTSKLRNAVQLQDAAYECGSSMMVGLATLPLTFYYAGPKVGPWLASNQPFSWLCIAFFVVVRGGAFGGYMAGLVGAMHYGLSVYGWRSALFAALCVFFGRIVFTVAELGGDTVWPSLTDSIRSVFVRNLFANISFELMQWGTFAVFVGGIMFGLTGNAIWLRFVAVMFVLATIVFGLFGGTAMAVGYWAIEWRLRRRGILPSGIGLKPVLDALVKEGLFQQGAQSGFIYEPFHQTLSDFRRKVL
jgi:hypothetical protein